MVLKRIKKEIQYLQKDSYINYVAFPNNNTDLLNWTAILIGPENSPYQGGFYYLSINFPQQYPFKPPKVSFQTLIFHPNINYKGIISLGILHSNWSPVLTISKILQSIFCLLTDPTPDDPQVPEIANIYKTDRQLYQKIAQEWNRRYAA